MKNLLKLSMLVFALLSAFTLQARSSGDHSVVFSKFVEPYVHGSLYLDLNGHASIDIAVLVNEEGIVDDWMPIRTNDKILIKSIGNVIDEWRFDPRDESGKPSWAFYQFTVDFKKTGSVISITPQEAVMTLFNTLKDDFTLVVPFDELDGIPKPIEIDEPVIHTSMKGNNSGKSVRMEFFIDDKGAVRMPVVVESSVDTQVASILMEALFEWKFEPPLKNGRKVATKAVVPFNIK